MSPRSATRGRRQRGVARRTTYDDVLHTKCGTARLDHAGSPRWPFTPVTRGDTTGRGHEVLGAAATKQFTAGDAPREVMRRNGPSIREWERSPPWRDGRTKETRELIKDAEAWARPRRAKAHRGCCLCFGRVACCL